MPQARKIECSVCGNRGRLGRFWVEDSRIMLACVDCPAPAQLPLLTRRIRERWDDDDYARAAHPRLAYVRSDVPSLIRPRYAPKQPVEVTEVEDRTVN